MILTIKLKLDETKENYQAVIKALEGFDIASSSWEDQPETMKSTVSGKTDPSDLAGQVSAAVDKLRRRHSGL